MNIYKEKKKDGFTLMEVMIVVAILVAIIGAVAMFQQNVFRFNSIIDTSLRNHNELNKILNPLANEIRSAEVSDSGSYPIEQASSTSVTFYSDIDGDGSAERIRYFLSGNDFKKGIVQASGNPPVYNLEDEEIIQVVHYIVDIGVPMFQYYGYLYNGSTSTPPLSDPIDVSDIKLISVSVSSDSDPNRLPGPSTVSTVVTIRNL